MWSIKTYNSYLVCGTVDGKVLLLDKATLFVEKELVLGKKNIGSLYLDGEALYAAGHDGKLFKVSMRSFEIESSVKNAHKKMFDCAGIYEDSTYIENNFMYISSRNISGIDRISLKELYQKR